MRSPLLTKDLQSEDTKDSKPPLVIYHDNCDDGITSAWLWWTHHDSRTGIDAEYQPSQYQNDLDIKDFENRIVVILDFSFPYKEMLSVIKAATKVIVIDHHASSQRTFDELRLNDEVIEAEASGKLVIKMNMNQCASTLTHDYLCENELTFDKERPKLLEYIEDRDLWKWKLPGSKALSASIRILDRNFDTWTELFYRAETELETMIEEGKHILAYQSIIVKKYTTDKKIGFISLDGILMPVINCADPLLISEVGNKLSQDSPNGIAATFFVDNKGRVNYSLRCKKDCDLDAGAIAEKVAGGGGHPKAAGFRTDEMIKLRNLANV